MTNQSLQRDIDKVSGKLTAQDLERAVLNVERWGSNLQAEPENMQARIKLAAARIDLGQYEEAERLLLVAKSKWPDAIGVISLLSRLYERQRRHLEG